MKTRDFLKQHNAYADDTKWALSISSNMADVWDTMIKQGKYELLLWTLTKPELFTDSVLRRLACRFVRETPMHDGRKVWDLLTDERSRTAVEMAERHADGKVTNEELSAAHNAASAVGVSCDVNYVIDDVCFADHAAAGTAAKDAGYAVYTAARNACAAACTAAYDIADTVLRSAAWNAVDAAQIKMISELGNPFKERAGR